MPQWSPAIALLVSDIPSRDGGFRISPPIAWQVPGEQIGTESGSYVSGNRVSEKGELQGAYQPKLQDTYISGTGSRTGKAFTVSAGTVKDDWVSPETKKYGLLFPKANDTFDVVAATPDSRIVNARFILKRGSLPTGVTPAASNFYTYINLCYLNNTDYRIALLWGKPLTLDYYSNGAWQIGADVSKNIPNLQNWFAAHNDQIALDVIANYNDSTITVRFGNHVALTFKDTNGLPAYGNVRVTGQNGWGHFEYYPLRFAPLTVTKKVRDFGQIMPIGGASLATNGRAYPSAAQSVTASLTGSAQAPGYTLTASLPDAGDGLGSVDPPIVADATFLMPGVWVNNFTPQVYLPPAIRCDILETFDDASRCFTASASIPVNNWNSRYTGSYGQVAVAVDFANGVDPPARAFTGIGGGGPRGIEFYRNDPTRTMTIPCSDNSLKMLVPIGEEICLDGYAWASAVRLVAELGNVHPQFLQTIPHYVPPSGTYDAPFGPAGSDWNGYVLGKGSGLNAKYKFLPNETAWSVLLQIIQEMSYVDPVTLQAFPYYMGFDPYGSGQFLFQPYNPKYIPPKIAYVGNDPTGLAQFEEIRVYNSVYQMRTSLDFQGIDAFTNELLYYHLNMPDAVMQTVGFAYPWMERSAKFASAGYMQTIAQAAAAQASQPTQVVTVKVPYRANVHAGDTCIIADANTIGGGGVYYITELRTAFGQMGPHDGHAESCSYITARNVQNF